MPDNTLDIAIRTQVEISALRQLEDSLQNQIVKARSLGTELEKIAHLESQLATVRTRIAGMGQAVAQTSGAMEIGGRHAFMLTNNFVRMGESGTASFHGLAHEAILLSHTMGSFGGAGAAAFTGVGIAAIGAGIALHKINELSKETDENWKAAGVEAQGYLKNFLQGVGAMEPPHVSIYADMVVTGEDLVKREMTRLADFQKEVFGTPTPVEAGQAAATPFEQEWAKNLEVVKTKDIASQSLVNGINPFTEYERINTARTAAGEATPFPHDFQTSTGEINAEKDRLVAKLKTQIDELVAKNKTLAVKQVGAGNEAMLQAAGFKAEQESTKAGTSESINVAKEKEKALDLTHPARSTVDKVAGQQVIKDMELAAEKDAKIAEVAESKRLLSMQISSRGGVPSSQDTAALAQKDKEIANIKARFDATNSEGGSRTLEKQNEITEAYKKQAAIKRDADLARAEAQEKAAKATEKTADASGNYALKQSALDAEYDAERKILMLKIESNEADEKNTVVLREQLRELEESNALRKSGAADRLKTINSEQAFALGGLSGGEASEQTRKYQKKRLEELIPFGTDKSKLSPEKAQEAMELIEQMRKTDPMQAQQYTKRYFDGKPPTVTEFEDEKRKLKGVAGSLDAGGSASQSAMASALNSLLSLAQSGGFRVQLVDQKSANTNGAMPPV